MRCQFTDILPEEKSEGKKLSAHSAFLKCKRMMERAVLRLLRSALAELAVNRTAGSQLRS